ncbi:MAG: segregation/condensation protein A [Mycoplasmataceae bacterium]|jgi:segregation and condensation protein A|nr:segregation/condensation protein A [Mycoplasmataceae bacterium]
MNNLNLKLNNFSGPLDVLNNLIQEKKIDIIDLDILELTDQYLFFVQNNISNNNIEIDEISEYLTMATYLLELKSKKILPNLSNEEKIKLEQERDDLVQRILNYKKYKDSIPFFEKKKEKRELMLNKETIELEDFVVELDPISKLPNSINIKYLSNAFVRATNDFNIRELFKKNIQIKEISIDDVEKDIKCIIQANLHSKLKFMELINKLDKNKITLQYLIVCFLVLLELAKCDNIKLEQQNDIEDFFLIIK